MEGDLRKLIADPRVVRPCFDAEAVAPGAHRFRLTEARQTLDGMEKAGRIVSEKGVTDRKGRRGWRILEPFPEAPDGRQPRTRPNTRRCTSKRRQAGRVATRHLHRPAMRATVSVHGTPAHCRLLRRMGVAGTGLRGRAGAMVGAGRFGARPPVRHGKRECRGAVRVRVRAMAAARGRRGRTPEVEKS